MTRSLTSSVLVGRQDELAVLAEMLGELISDGSGGLLLIAGEAGVGKSRLIEVLAELTDDQQVQMLVGNCVQFGEEKLPAAPLIDILGDLTDTLDEEELEAVIGPARTDLAGLVPVLGPRPSDEKPLEPHRLFELVRGVLARLAARGPAVLVIEDLHWADRTTRDLVGFLASAMGEDPVLLVATYRSDELHRRHPLLPALAELQRAVRPERLDLAPFDAETTAELVAAIRGDELDAATVELIHRRSGGNAFFLEELLAATDPRLPVPTTLRDVVLSRSLSLDDDAVTILRVASAVGSRIDETLLVRVADLDKSKINAALHQLVDNHFLVSDERQFRFRHDLTREVFADELLPGERADLHERIADVLQEIAPDRLGEIAHHWYQSGNQPRALRSAMAAGEAANRVGATAEALLHFERVLELWERVTALDRPTHLSHADLLFLAADAADLLQEFRRSVDLARQACDELAEADHVTRAPALIKLSKWLWNAGEPGIDEAIALALELIEPEPASADVAWVLARAAGLDMMSGGFEEAIERAEIALEMARATGNRKAEANTLTTIALCRWGLGDEGATDEMRAATMFAVEIGDGNEVDRGYVNLSELLALDGRYEEAVATALEGMSYLEAHDYRGVCAALLVENALRGLEPLGRWDELDDLSEQVLTWRRLDLDVPAPTGLTISAKVMVKRGETDRARPLLEHDLKAELTGYYCGNAAVIVSALLELDQIEGRPTPNRELVDSAIDLLSSKKDHRLLEVMAAALRSEADAAIAAGYLGDDAAVADGREVAERWIGHVENQITDRSHSAIAPEFDVLVAQCRAEHARAHDRNEPRHWASVAAGWKQLEQPWPTAYSQWRHAEAILLARNQFGEGRPDSQRLLSEAHATATRLGAKPLVSDIADLATRARIDLIIDQTDEPPTEPDLVVAVPFDLTPRELSVLELVAEGYSNGRIGKELFISTKTASVHVSNILRKLDATNRIEAAAIANKVGITRSTEESDLELAGQGLD